MLTLVILSAGLSGCLSSDEDELEEFLLSAFQMNKVMSTKIVIMMETTLHTQHHGAHIANQFYKPLTIQSLQDNHRIQQRTRKYSDMNEWKDRMESELKGIYLIHLSMHLRYRNHPTSLVFQQCISLAAMG